MKKISILFISLLLAACSAPTSMPTSTSTSTSSPTASATPTTITTSLQIALVDEIGVPGADTFGCGDKIEMVNRSVSTTTPLQTAISELLSVNTRNYGMSGLTSALYQNNFTINSVTITGTHALIDLSGTMAQDGACDSPRIQEQMKRTILQFPTITTYDIKLNGNTNNWNCLFNQSGSC